MNEHAPALFVALEASNFAAAIRQPFFLYPLANVGHIVSLVCFAGAIGVMDVRLLGGLSATAPGRVIGRARRFAIGALCGLAVTGFMLFAAEASHVALNPVFQLKMALITVGIADVAIYELAARRVVEGLPPGAPMPTRARMIGGFSLGSWLLVAACGRSIAYF